MAQNKPGQTPPRVSTESPIHEPPEELQRLLQTIKTLDGFYVSVVGQIEQFSQELTTARSLFEMQRERRSEEEIPTDKLVESMAMLEKRKAETISVVEKASETFGLAQNTKAQFGYSIPVFTVGSLFALELRLAFGFDKWYHNAAIFAVAIGTVSAAAAFTARSSTIQSAFSRKWQSSEDQSRADQARLHEKSTEPRAQENDIAKALRFEVTPESKPDQPSLDHSVPNSINQIGGQRLVDANESAPLQPSTFRQHMIYNFPISSDRIRPKYCYIYAESMGSLQRGNSTLLGTSRNQLAIAFYMKTDFLPACIQHEVFDPRIHPRQIVKQNWTFEKILGKGGAGSVRLEKEEISGELRALKVINKEFLGECNIDYIHELRALARFLKEKSFFIHFDGWFEDEDSLYIAMEYIKKGDLTNYLAQDWEEEDVKEIIRQVLGALNLMHGDGFTHRDVKPANIFVCSTGPKWWVKLGDMGISKAARPGVTSLHTLYYSSGYAAPEMTGAYVRDEEEDEDEDEDSDDDVGQYSNKVDLWSVGCIVYEMFSKTLLFAKNKQLKSYCSGRRPFPEEPLHNTNITKEGIEFIKCLLVPNPDERPTSEQALNSPWLLCDHMRDYYGMENAPGYVKTSR